MELTCIRCPMGCAIHVEMENGQVVSVTGNTCPRGAEYAKSEATAVKPQHEWFILTCCTIKNHIDLSSICRNIKTFTLRNNHSVQLAHLHCITLKHSF